MALVNFTNLDFDQIKTSIKDYLRSNSNFTDYDFEGSNLSVLIDVLAYNTYISSYNANMISNEVFIDGATLRENVVSLAKTIGYVPRSRKSARANISFFVDTTGFSTNPLTLTLKRGTVCSSSTSFGNTSYTFSVPDDITVPVVNGIAFFDSISVYEGTFLTSNFTVNSLNPAPPQRYILDNANIDTSSIQVSVRNSQASTISRKFLASDSIFEVTPTSRIFFVQEIEDQRYELIFGDGIFGEKLENLNYIEASYIITNGEDGNGVSSFIFNGRILDNNGNVVTNGVSLITTNIVSEGGKEIESVQSIKNYAPRIYASQNRAVTSNDYEALIPKIYPEAESVSVFGGEELVPPQFGKVFISIKPFYGPFVPNSIKDNLKKELRKYSVAGIVPEIMDLKYLYVETDSTVYYNANLAPSPEYVKTIVSQNIQNYSDSTELNRYGARFKYSKFQKIIDDSHESVTSNITKLAIRRDLSAKLNQIVQYEICFGNAFHIKNVNGYNIKSSGFTISGNPNTLYMSDIPNADQTNGNIFFFQLISETEGQIVRQSAGTIDYVKGEILLNPVNFTSTSKSIGGDPIIEISTSPKSNDVIGLQDLYLQLDTSKSVLNMLSDEISSGADPSGSTYQTTSSYLNGTLVRL
jgi:hypothetical protein